MKSEKKQIPEKAINVEFPQNQTIFLRKRETLFEKLRENKKS